MLGIVVTVFRVFMDCPCCHGVAYYKDGIVHGRQRYHCKQCRYRYTVAAKSDVRPPETKHLALKIYLEGLGFRAIGRLLNVSHTAVGQKKVTAGFGLLLTD